MKKFRFRYLLIAVMILVMLSVTAHAIPASLRVGSTGDQVRTVQSRLKQWGYYDGAVDGIFGSGTERAVKRFQKNNGLVADGIVGPATGKKIGITITSTSGGGTSSYSSDDVYLLARCVYAEARGEPYTGQVAVAAVVLNRVNSSQFPNTISGVIYQRLAFSSVADGQINMKPSDEAIRAAKDAINGWDPSGNAMYFYNPKTSTSEWIFTRTVVAKIGRHNFAV